MGMFSWITSDTQESITNNCTNDGALPAKMLAPDGRVWEESNYEGYGIFGGKDYYELLAELNGAETRDDGITMAFKNNPGGDNTSGIIYPKLVTLNCTNSYENLDNSLSCPDQGYFYCEEDEEEHCSWCGEEMDYCTCDECDECGHHLDDCNCDEED